MVFWEGFWSWVEGPGLGWLGAVVEVLLEGKTAGKNSGELREGIMCQEGAG